MASGSWEERGLGPLRTRVLVTFFVLGVVLGGGEGRVPFF